MHEVIDSDLIQTSDFRLQIVSFPITGYLTSEHASNHPFSKARPVNFLVLVQAKGILQLAKRGQKLDSIIP